MLQVPGKHFTQYFASPKRQRILPTPPGAEVVNFCLIPRSSPHFSGSHDPVAVIALLSSGELLTLTFPSGMPISPTNQLPLSLTFVHPFVKRLGIAQAGREKWLGLQERRQQGTGYFKWWCRTITSYATLRTTQHCSDDACGRYYSTLGFWIRR